MTSRLASEVTSDDDDSDSPQPPNKRSRIQTNPPAFLDSLNSDCLFTILSYLPAEDLNSVAICSRRYRRARAHESLDQTRSGAIVVSEGCTVYTLADKIIESNWNQVFQGNRTHLKIEGLERMREDTVEKGGIRFGAELSGVRRLEMSFNGAPESHYKRELSNLLCLFPNLTSVDLTSVPRGISQMFQRCPNIISLAWNGSSGTALNGIPFRAASHLSQLYLDDYCFHLIEEEMLTMSGMDLNIADTFLFSLVRDSYAFRYCRHLERLSIKNATWKDFVSGGADEASPVSQEMLIKMVRRHPTLRWLRSDLSPENVAMLRQERPEITFVSE